MTERVELERLLEVAAGFGTAPMLLTTDEDGRPRAAAVTVGWEGDVAVVSAGRHSLRNAVARPLVGLLWPAPPGERFALLVDCEVVEVSRADPADERAGGTIRAHATSAILHVVDRRPKAARRR